MQHAVSSELPVYMLCSYANVCLNMETHANGASKDTSACV